MLATAALHGLRVAALAGGLVYADATARDLPEAVRLRWSAGVTVSSLLGFLGAFWLDGVIVRVFLALNDRPVPAADPRQLVASLFVAGLAVGAGTVLAYGIGSRFGPLAST